MELKDIVDKILKEQNRSFSWLAVSMNKTFDGLKLSLIKGSVKYSDLKKMSEVLKVPPSTFFDDSETEGNLNILQEHKEPYYSKTNELDSCREMVEILKTQVKDKEKIIELLARK